jgi:hypothetical protein
MFILSGDEHPLMPNENRVILRLHNENGRWNRESYVLIRISSVIYSLGGLVIRRRRIWLPRNHTCDQEMAQSSTPVRLLRPEYVLSGP